MTHRLRALLAGLAVGVVLAVFLPAAPAAAHASLVRTDPAAGSILSFPPSEIVLSFSESVRAVNQRIQITGPDGARADNGEATVQGQDLVIGMRPETKRGSYVVSYRIISGDSHPVSGGFTFSIGEVSASQSQPATSDTKTDPVMTTAIAVSKYLGYAGLVLLVGPVLFMLSLWPQRLSRLAPARMATLGLGLLGFGTVLAFYLQIPYTSGTGIFEIGGTATRDVVGSSFGAAHLVRLGVLLALAVLLRPINAGRATGSDRILLSILGVVGLATWPVSGHPGSSPVPTLTVVADVAHLAAMSVWLGGLVVLAGILLPKGSNRELRAILPIWSGWAMFAIAVLVLAGTAQALVEIGTWGALTGTAYGRYVIAKVALVALVVAVAFFSRRYVQRGFGGDKRDDPPTSRLRLSVLAEVGIAVIIIGITSVLVQTTPGRTAEANLNSAYLPFTATINSNLYQLQVNVEPTTTGPNTLHLYALTPDGKSPITVLEWKGKASLPSAGVDGIDIALLQITKDHAIGQVVLPTAGTWELSFTLRTSDIDQATVATKLVVRNG